VPQNARNQSDFLGGLSSFSGQVNNVKHLWPKRPGAFCILLLSWPAGLQPQLETFQPLYYNVGPQHTAHKTKQNTDRLWGNLCLGVGTISMGKLKKKRDGWALKN